MSRVAAARAAIAVVLVLVVGCGLPQDDNPRVIAAGDIPLPSSTTTSEPATGTRGIEIWLANGDGLLEPFERSVESMNVPSALDALLAGPDESESARFRSAIPEGATLITAAEEPVAIIQLGAPNTGVLSIQGEEQVLAFAQIVATAMGLPGVDGVQFIQEDGTVVPAPTFDSGTVADRPITNADYASLLED